MADTMAVLRFISPPKPYRPTPQDIDSPSEMSQPRLTRARFSAPSPTAGPRYPQTNSGLGRDTSDRPRPSEHRSADETQAVSAPLSHRVKSSCSLRNPLNRHRNRPQDCLYPIVLKALIPLGILRHWT